MRIHFLLWAQMRIDAGRSRIPLDLPEGSTLGIAVEAFYAAHPVLLPHRSSARAAVGTEYVPEDRPLADGDEVSLIPPVQGG